VANCGGHQQTQGEDTHERPAGWENKQGSGQWYYMCMLACSQERAFRGVIYLLDLFKVVCPSIGMYNNLQRARQSDRSSTCRQGNYFVGASVPPSGTGLGALGVARVWPV
jgi:hypothetical protein